MPAKRNMLSDAPCLALRRKGVAKALGISERIVTELTSSGALPHVRLTRRLVIYDIASLQKWLAEQATKGDGK
jgi:hypothetical protein